ncbi:plp-dependent transferase [Fusarium sp. NRRL 52700]|nr:plp-dependent transferase [Fusarium sp. NRRL 52700]
MDTPTGPRRSHRGPQLTGLSRTGQNGDSTPSRSMQGWKKTLNSQPTHDGLEKRIAALEDGRDAPTFSSRGFGTVITFGLKGGAAEAISLIDSFEMIINTTNAGDSKTLVERHWSTTHNHFTKEENLSMGVDEDLVRLSLGIEDARDIIADFEQAFERIGRKV